MQEREFAQPRSRLTRTSRLGPALRRVFVATDRDRADFHDAAEHLGSYVGTTRVVTEVFSEQFFAPVWSREARLDRHVRNMEGPLIECLYCAMNRGVLCK